MIRFTLIILFLLILNGWQYVYCYSLDVYSENISNEDDISEARMHPDFNETGIQSRIESFEMQQEFWLQKGRNFIEQASSQPNTKVAKNIIMFIGDGLGLATLAATRSYIGGEEVKLSFEEFPTTGLSRTYCLDRIVADSACTATAYLCGVKANYGTIGVNGQVKRGNCSAQQQIKNHVSSIAKWALDAGKAAGLVTTTSITDASPSGVYAHTAERDWQNDASLKLSCGTESKLQDIALQLIHGDVGKKLKVALGGGRSNFQDSSSYLQGLRSDGRDLIKEFLDLHEDNKFASTREELLNINPHTSKRLLGTFSSSEMDYHLDALANPNNTQPTLEEMTRKALEMMANEKNGYFLFIEGGEIDLAHHAVMVRKALDETAEFAKAIATARQLTNEDDTLIVVTSDHSHTFSLAGYQNRGSDIFSAASIKATDGFPYIPLSYANGEAFEKFFDTKANKRVDPTTVLNQTKDDKFPSTVPIDSETHGGEDVAVFASGPWNHLFSGVYDQNTIPHLMAFAACIGEGLKVCDKF